MSSRFVTPTMTLRFPSVTLSTAFSGSTRPGNRLICGGEHRQFQLSVSCQLAAERLPQLDVLPPSMAAAGPSYSALTTWAQRRRSWSSHCFWAATSQQGFTTRLARGAPHAGGFERLLTSCAPLSASRADSRAGSARSQASSLPRLRFHSENARPCPQSPTQSRRKLRGVVPAKIRAATDTGLEGGGVGEVRPYRVDVLTASTASRSTLLGKDSRMSSRFDTPTTTLRLPSVTLSTAFSGSTRPGNRLICGGEHRQFQLSLFPASSQQNVCRSWMCYPPSMAAARPSHSALTTWAKRRRSWSSHCFRAATSQQGFTTRLARGAPHASGFERLLNSCEPVTVERDLQDYRHQVCPGYGFTVRTLDLVLSQQCNPDESFAESCRQKSMLSPTPVWREGRRVGEVGPTELMS